MTPEQKPSLINTKLSRRTLLKSGGKLIDGIGIAGIPITIYSGEKAHSIDKKINQDITRNMPDAPNHSEVANAKETLIEIHDSLANKDMLKGPEVVTEMQEILSSDDISASYSILKRDKEREVFQHELEHKYDSDTWNSRTFFGLLTVAAAGIRRIWIAK